MKPPFFRTPYNHDVKAFSDECAYVERCESLTIQSHAEDADINVIVRRFGLTGVMPPLHRVPEFGDYSGISSFQDAMNAVNAAQEHFDDMPWEVRARFGNDPQQFLDFCSVKDNLPEMRKLGLAVPEVLPDTTLADVVKAVKESSGGDRQAGTAGKAGD